VQRHAIKTRSITPSTQLLLKCVLTLKSAGASGHFRPRRLSVNGFESVRCQRYLMQLAGDESNVTRAQLLLRGLRSATSPLSSSTGSVPVGVERMFNYLTPVSSLCRLSVCINHSDDASKIHEQNNKADNSIKVRPSRSS